MSEKRKAEDLLGLDSLDAEDTMSVLADFPELSKMVEVDGKKVVVEETDMDDYPFGALQRKLDKMDDDKVIRYLEGLEIALEVSMTFILDNAGLEGTERVRENLKQKEIKVLEPEMIPIFVQSQLIDTVEEEMEKRGLLKDFRKNHPYYHYVSEQPVVYDHYHDRMTDMLAMYSAQYIDDYALMYLVDSISHNIHANLDSVEEEKEETKEK